VVIWLGGTAGVTLNEAMAVDAWISREFVERRNAGGVTLTTSTSVLSTPS